MRKGKDSLNTRESNRPLEISFSNKARMIGTGNSMRSLPKLIKIVFRNATEKPGFANTSAKFCKLIPRTPEYSLGVVEFLESEYNSVNGNVGKNQVKKNGWNDKNIQVLVLCNFFPPPNSRLLYGQRLMKVKLRGVTPIRLTPISFYTVILRDNYRQKHIRFLDPVARLL